RDAAWDRSAPADSRTHPPLRARQPPTPTNHLLLRSPDVPWHEPGRERRTRRVSAAPRVRQWRRATSFVRLSPVPATIARRLRAEKFLAEPLASAAPCGSPAIPAPDAATAAPTSPRPPDTADP